MSDSAPSSGAPLSEAPLSSAPPSVSPPVEAPSSAATPASLAPDADAVVADTESFRVVDCPACAGMLKPDIVYFGESVPKDRVAEAYSMVEQAEADTRFTEKFFSNNEFAARLTREARRAAYRMIRRRLGLQDAA